MKRLVILSLLALAIPWAAPAATPGWQRWSIPETGVYALRYLPATLDQTQPVPVIVFLHGSGSSPEAWQGLLQGEADAAGCVLVMTKATSNLGFGVGADDRTIALALDRLRAELPVDEARISIAGHSAGGAYAAVLAYAARTRFAGVFILGAPYRTVLALADPDYVAPLLMYYGTTDPNFTGASYSALVGQWQRLGVPWQEEIAPGFGHSGWPPTTLADGFTFLLAQRYGTAGGCVPTPTRLCLGDGRFAVTASFRTAGGATGAARVAEERTRDSGLFWFFQADNWELQVKVLDACVINDRFWVFAAGTTDVEVELEVEDLQAGVTYSHLQPGGASAPALTDTGALATCP
ncbi:MAG TPA: hypothetical protein VF017_03475 [Thermoanaerobaculia bacterium]|nr:hypothetical protein [Thermoanaerobaculia bacterium]